LIVLVLLVEVLLVVFVLPLLDPPPTDIGVLIPFIILIIDNGFDVLPALARS